MTEKTVYRGHLVFNMHNMMIFSRRFFHDRATVIISHPSSAFILIAYCSNLANKDSWKSDKSHGLKMGFFSGLIKNH